LAQASLSHWDHARQLLETFTVCIEVSMKSATALLTLLGSAMAAFPEECPNVTVIRSVALAAGEDNSWLDACLGLALTKDTTMIGCKEACHKNHNCSVWQFLKKGPKDKPEKIVEECWSGNAAHGCLGRERKAEQVKLEEELVGGERIRHGEIKVVSNNTQEATGPLEFIGLKNYPEDYGTEEAKQNRCKLACETDTSCTVWQYGKKDGCWMEHAPDNFQQKSVKDSEWAKEQFVMGQNIEHVCPQYEAPTGLPWPWIISGLVLGVLALGAVIFLLQKQPKVKKTRAIKIDEPVEVVRPVYFVPQPTMLIPQSSVVMPMYQPAMQPLMR